MTSVICDLDGVVYVDTDPVPGSAQALAALNHSGVVTVFATNNSTRTPEETARKITAITGVDIDPAQIVTSAQAAAGLVDGSSLAIVVGGNGIMAALREVGARITDDPLEASVVVVGMDPHVTYDKIAAASRAIRNGAMFIASNDDATYPSPDGPLPGAGAVVAAIATASGADPVVAGKPNEPMRDLLRSRVGSDAWVIGDRIETDISMAQHEPGWKSILVLTGVTSTAEAKGSADFVARDLFEAATIVTSAATRP